MLKNIIIVDPYAERAWELYSCEINLNFNFNIEIKNAYAEDLFLLRNTFSNKNLNHTIAVFGTNDEIGNIKYAATFRKIYDKENSLKYIIRSVSTMSISDKFFDNILGKEYILIPTFDWVKAYFKEQYKLRMLM